jgi:tetratricopeptide (TPR) repeat protein
MQQRSMLVPARQQSKTLKVLEDRLKQYQNPQFQEIQQSVNANNARVRQQKTIKPATSQPSGGIPQNVTGMSGFRGGPGMNRQPAITLPPSSVPATDVASLAEGIKATGLHDLMLSAEQLMAQGKFQSAINKYNAAEGVAPNNALIPLGRGNAELGAGYYNQASVDIHQAFEADPAMLLGRYALDKWISSKRIDFVTNELRDLAAGDKSQEMPVFLLAYLSYNTGQDAKAMEYLQEAQKRAGNNDPLLANLETRWKPMPAGAATPAPDLNK